MPGRLLLPSHPSHGAIMPSRISLTLGDRTSSELKPPSQRVFDLPARADYSTAQSVPPIYLPADLTAPVAYTIMCPAAVRVPR